MREDKDVNCLICRETNDTNFLGGEGDGDAKLGEKKESGFKREERYAMVVGFAFSEMETETFSFISFK